MSNLSTAKIGDKLIKWTRHGKSLVTVEKDSLEIAEALRAVDSALRSLEHATGIVSQTLIPAHPDTDEAQFARRAYSRLIAVDARLRLASYSEIPALIERVMEEYETSAVPYFERIRDANDAATAAVNRVLGGSVDNDDDGML